MLWCYITPIIGAIVADQYLGRLATIIHSSVVYMFGLTLLCFSPILVTSMYSVSVSVMALGMTFIGVGTGGIKANVGSFLAEQYTRKEERITTTDEGEKIMIDPKVTIQRYLRRLDRQTMARNLIECRIFMMFYLFVNIGSTSGIITTTVEDRFSFSAAFTVPLFVFFLGFGILLLTKKIYVVQVPQGSAIPNAFRVLWKATSHKFDLETAKPSYEALHGNSKSITLWDDSFVEEVRRTLIACRVFLFLPFYFVSYVQIYTNFVSQAATMETHGIPNDMMVNIDAITVIIFTPLLDRFFYPFLRRHGINFWPITRIAVAFNILGVAMAYTAMVQYFIYTSPPCFNHPRSKDCLGATVPNQIHVALQTPSYFLIAISEILAVATCYEYAFTKAPSSMKSFVAALFMSTTAIGDLLGILITPLSVDPKIVWMYTGLAAQSFLTGAVFYFWLRDYNKLEARPDQRTAEHDGLDNRVTTVREEQ